MPPKNPFDILEVANRIASFLRNKELASCVRVSKHWRDLFLPHLWSFVDAGSISDPELRRRCPLLEDVYNHRHLLHRLTLFGELPKLDQENYPNLRILYICFENTSQKPEQPISLDIVTMFPSLDKLTFVMVNLSPTIWTTLPMHPHLRRMELSIVEIKGTDAPVFWRACQNLEYLGLIDATIKGGRIPADVLFHRMRHVELSSIELDDSVQMDLILHCPRLEHITWEFDEEKDFDQQALIHHPVQNGHWPHLDELHIACPLQDTDMATILKGVGNGFGNVVKLHANGMRLKAQAFRALALHFDTLVDLNLTECQPNASRAIRDILCGCPNLECLHATSITAKDIAEGGAWICLKLRELAICFLVDESEQDLQPLIFEHLSTLVRLEKLALWPSPIIEDDQGRVLEFRVGCGLKKLASLQQLTSLTFGKIGGRFIIWMMFHDYTPFCPQLSMDDIVWMVDHWWLLKMIEGPLNEDKVLEEQLICELRSCGIRYHETAGINKEDYY
jgi:hypothetical protein